MAARPRAGDRGRHRPEHARLALSAGAARPVERGEVPLELIDRRSAVCSAPSTTWVCSMIPIAASAGRWTTPRRSTPKAACTARRHAVSRASPRCCWKTAGRRCHCAGMHASRWSGRWPIPRRHARQLVGSRRGSAGRDAAPGLERALGKDGRIIHARGANVTDDAGMIKYLNFLNWDRPEVVQTRVRRRR